MNGPTAARPFASARSTPLLPTFQLMVVILLGGAVLGMHAASPRTVILAAAIAFFALLPSYLWCSGRVHGLPIFPVFALTFLWTYAYQLIAGHPVVASYSGSDQIRAATTVCLFLLGSTLAWLPFASLPPRVRIRHVALDPERAEPALLGVLAAGFGYWLAFGAGWLTLPPGINSILRSVTLSLVAVSAFVIAYRLGRGQLSPGRSWIFAVFLIGYVVVTAASLLLIGAMTISFLAAAGFTLGRGRLPHRAMILGMSALIFLHYGKGNIRNQYWANGGEPLRPWDYPTLYAEWAAYSAHNLWTGAESDTGVQSFAERAGLLHLLLIAQDRTDHGLPFLEGATYAPIPLLLVPRVLLPTKPPSHAGTYMLNLHFGLQTPESIGRTTIGWGLLNEAFGNFGRLGVLLIALLLGLGFGVATRWSAGAPALSFRFLLAIILINLAIQSEFSLGVWLSVLFQYSVPLILLALFARRIDIQTLDGSLRQERARPPARLR